jgi:iron complex outermembrane receptor protein
MQITRPRSSPTRYNAPTNEFFPPEESEAYEIGLKFEDLWDGRMGGSLSYFTIDKINVLRTGAENITRVPFTELSEDQSKGFEAELFMNITDNWNSVLNYSYLDAKVIESRTGPAGLPLEGAPPHRLTFWTSYGIQHGFLKGLRFGGGVIWADGPIQQFNTSPNALVLEDGYTEVDLFARYDTKIAERPVTFGVNVANATDTFYLRARAMVNDPRQVVFSVKVGL